MRVPFRSVTFEDGLWADYMPRNCQVLSLTDLAEII